MSPAARSGVSSRLRFEILRRDNYQCRYCGCGADTAPLVVDHVLPVSLGGRTEASNLATACDPCNTGKASIAPDQALVEDVRVDAEAWARAREAAMQGLRASNAYVGFEREISEFNQAWCDWTIGDDDRPLPRDANWQRSLRVWFLRGVPLDVMLELITDAMGRNNLPPEAIWKYFCGCVWTWVRQVEETTERIFNADRASAVYHDAPVRPEEPPETESIEAAPIALGPVA